MNLSRGKPLDVLGDPRHKTVNTVFDFDGHQIYTQFLRASRPTDRVLFRFHGAMKRDLRPLPAYQANLRHIQDHAHQISICDPTMMSREGFSCAWYAGHESLDTQGLLTRFCAEASRVLGARRAVYMGSSGGGFAALYFAHRHPGSVALATVPQTDVTRHFLPNSVKSYTNACWPGLSLEEVAARTCLNVGDLYSQGFDNAVIYVQSAGDIAHNVLQMTPFLAATLGDRVSPERRVVLCSDFWGKMGHGGVIPGEGYMPWLRAALSAPDISPEALLSAYHLARGTPQAIAMSPARAMARDGAGQGDGAEGFAPDDLRRADTLRNLMLGRAAPDEHTDRQTGAVR